MLEITNILSGPFLTNSYILWNKNSMEGILFDPCADVEFVTTKISDMGIKIIAIMLTHGHFDHNFAAGAFKERLQVPVYMNQKDTELIPIYKEQAVSYGFDASEYKDISDYSFLSDGDTIDILGETITVLEVPGHTRGSLIYLTSIGAVCGDVIFNGSIGRTDLWGGSQNTLMKSIADKVLTLPDKTVLYPGHGSKTTIGFEKNNNPFLYGLSLK